MRFALLVVAFSAGCLRNTSFHCATNDQCGAGGTCVTSVGGFCAFPDSACPGGRFGASAGDLSNTCVGSPGGDGGNKMDAPAKMDGMTGDDGMMNHCPNGYVTLTGGDPAHHYKVLTQADNWANQQSACSVTAPQFAHLAIPDDAAELAALDTAAGAANTPFWVGIHDPDQDNTWQTVKNTNQTFLPWDTGEPSSPTNPPQDCVEATATAGKIADERCNTQLPAICECD